MTKLKPTKATNTKNLPSTKTKEKTQRWVGFTKHLYSQSTQSLQAHNHIPTMCLEAWCVHLNKQQSNFYTRVEGFIYLSSYNTGKYNEIQTVVPLRNTHKKLFIMVECGGWVSQPKERSCSGQTLVNSYHYRLTHHRCQLTGITSVTCLQVATVSVLCVFTFQWKLLTCRAN